MTPSPAPRPTAGMLAPRRCGWCGRITTNWVVQGADDHAGEITWCQDAESCQSARIEAGLGR